MWLRGSFSDDPHASNSVKCPVLKTEGPVKVSRPSIEKDPSDDSSTSDDSSSDDGAAKKGLRQQKAELKEKLKSQLAQQKEKMNKQKEKMQTQLKNAKAGGPRDCAHAARRAKAGGAGGAQGPRKSFWVWRRPQARFAQKRGQGRAAG